MDGQRADVSDPTFRFSDRVESYVRARPSYPPEVVDAIEAETGLTPPAVVADVGSGTGIFSRLLLDRGYTVYGVEPNEPMRRAAERAFAAEPRFHSVPGRAEATTLEDASVDLVTAAQAFHWFDPVATRAEWSRILGPPRWVALLWNDRRSMGDFGRAYDAFLEEWGGPEYRSVRKSWDVVGSLERFFGSGAWVERRLPNHQRLDLAGLQDRLLSSSYLPGPRDPRHQAMLAAARALFEAHADGEEVTFTYETHVHVGRL